MGGEMPDRRSVGRQCAEGVGFTTRHRYRDYLVVSPLDPGKQLPGQPPDTSGYTHVFRGTHMDFHI